MRAAWYERGGQARVVRVVVDTLTPAPGAGEVRIRWAFSRSQKRGQVYTLQFLSHVLRHTLIEFDDRRSGVALQDLTPRTAVVTMRAWTS